MKNKLILLSVLTVTSLNAAVTINVITSSATGRYLDSGSATLQDNSIVMYGELDLAAYNLLSDAQKMDFASVDAVFEQLGSGAIASGDILDLGNSYPVPSGGINAGDQLYTWVFNSSSTVTATEWGIFSSSNPQWDMPADNGTSTLSSAFGIDNVVYGDFGVGGNVLLASVVPEPSTFAALAGIFALGAVALRRRRA